MIIAIDGTAAAGKSTLARRIAQRYGLPHLDTGSLYRAVARDVIKGGHALADVQAAAEAARNLDAATLSDPDLRLKGNGEAASVVAVYPEVRASPDPNVVGCPRLTTSRHSDFRSARRRSTCLAGGSGATAKK